MDTKKQFRIRIWLILLCAILIAGLTLFVPTPEGADARKFHLAIGLNVLNLAIFGPVVYFFFKAFPNFKKSIRVAYGCIALGFLLVTLGGVQFSFSLLTKSWAVDGISQLEFTLGTLLIFIGSWLYARLVGVRKVWALLPIMLVGVALLMWTVTVLPHAPNFLPEQGFDLLLAANAWQGSWILAGVIMLLVVKRHTNLIYNRALAWLVLALLCDGLACYSIITVAMASGIENWYIAYGIYVLPFIISGIAWLKSAEAFHNIIKNPDLPLLNLRGDHTFFGRIRQLAPDRPPTAIDVVLFLASLSSNPADIDTELDKVRSITANTSDASMLNQVNQEELAKAYIIIESYLAENDPVRKFSRSDLRQLTEERYRTITDAPYFWSKLDAKRVSQK